MSAGCAATCRAEEPESKVGRTPASPKPKAEAGQAFSGFSSRSPLKRAKSASLDTSTAS